MLIDAHAHLDRYDAEIEDALKEIRTEGIFTVSNSMDVPSYERNLEISEACDLVLPLFGVHPWNAPEHANHLEKLEPFIGQTPMIGEVGLDHFFVKDRSRYPDQRKVFEFFLAAAKKQNKIVNLHTKGAEEDVLALLSDYAVERAIIHWYSGSLDTLQCLADRGVYFTVGAEVLYSVHISEIARAVPLNQLLTETDNPGGPRSFLGSPGMPLLIKDVVRRIAGLRGSTYDEVVHQTQQNFLRLIQDDQGIVELHRRLVTRRIEGTQQRH